MLQAPQCREESRLQHRIVMEAAVAELVAEVTRIGQMKRRRSSNFFVGRKSELSALHLSQTTE